MSMRKLKAGSALLINLISAFWLTDRAQIGHEEFSNHQFMLATGFAICDQPHNTGYGTGTIALEKLMPLFLKEQTVAVLNETTTTFDEAF
ncbi:hypothetical protein BCR43DRAFT_512568 [Syncephalastrum racemosum]|uniref:Uncharacterized protein n=1 Tax=Syncephalastrum racemosum TaxID=13706 RepID=A0A1X2HQR9_SYNRA|nr:hypothetical protein BCR43DRAFT_512568 [Syncephalastrum racemosum]